MAVEGAQGVLGGAEFAILWSTRKMLFDAVYDILIAIIFAVRRLDVIS